MASALYYSGDVVIEGSTIDANDTDYAGGGIYVGSDGGRVGDLTISTSTIAGNTADYAGGGIFAEVVAFSLDRSTVSGNAAGGDANVGGGIGVYADTVDITSSTISGNDATGSGGGVFILGDDSTRIAHSTIAENAAGGDGGGLFIYDVGEIEIDHVILAGNTADGEGDELYGMGGPIAIANSLIEGEVAQVTVDDGGGNITGEDPMLGALADNGGPTQTHDLLDGSAALDAGDAAFAGDPATDQRGLPRIAARGHRHRRLRGPGPDPGRPAGRTARRPPPAGPGRPHLHRLRQRPASPVQSAAAAARRLGQGLVGEHEAARHQLGTGLGDLGPALAGQQLHVVDLLHRALEAEEADDLARCGCRPPTRRRPAGRGPR